MTFEELERGMKLLFDQQVHFADNLVKLEERQERLGAAQDRTDQQIAELTADQKVTMKAILTVVGSVGDLAVAHAEAQKRTEANIRELTESQKSTDAIVAALGRRIDAFIAALGNGHPKSP